MKKYLHDDRVEALAFDYIHFYGNMNTFAWSPRWYRQEPRILRNNIPSWAPEGLFFIVMERHKRGRYPRAALTGAKIYHYGWVRSEEQMNLKARKVGKYWSGKGSSEIKYSDIDGAVLREFQGRHPAVMQEWLHEAEGVFKASPSHKLSRREIKHRVALYIEKVLGVDLSKKHFKLVR